MEFDVRLVKLRVLKLLAPRALIIVIAIGQCAIISTQARAASLDRSNDGRIVLSVFGERLYFRERDAASVTLHVPHVLIGGIQQGDTVCAKPGARWPMDRYFATLADWLNDDAFGRCLSSAFSRVEARDPDIADRVLQLTLKFKLEDGLVYPGAVSAKEFQSLKPPIDDARYAVGLYVNSFSGGGSSCRDPAQQPEDEFGFLWHPDVFHIDDKLKWSVYSLAPEHRRDHATRQLCVACVYGIGDDAGCFAGLKSLEKPAELYFSSDEGHDAERRLVKPRSNWIDYDEGFRSVADSIFADRPKGYLQ